MRMKRMSQSTSSMLLTPPKTVMRVKKVVKATMANPRTTSKLLGRFLTLLVHCMPRNRERRRS